MRIPPYLFLLTGRNLYGHGHRHPYHSRSRHDGDFTNSVLLLFTFRCRLYFHGHDNATLWRENEIHGLRGSIYTIFLQPKPDLANLTVILFATKEEDVYRHYRHTDFFLRTVVSKL